MNSEITPVIESEGTEDARPQESGTEPVLVELGEASKVTQGGWGSTWDSGWYRQY